MTTTSSTSASQGSAILTALGGGSGIDTGSLVSGLVSATYDPKDAALKTKETANTAKISQLATLTSGIDTFASALNTLISGGTLSTQPSSSDTSILTAKAKAGASIGGLSATLEVRQLAKAQSLVSDYYANSGTALGLGSLTLATAAGKTFNITIDASNNSLAGVARAVNATNSGVVASVVTDANGARLVLKGQTGSANSFSLLPGANSDASLNKLSYGVQSMKLIGADVASSYYMTDSSSVPVGQGDMTLTVGGVSQTITIDASHDNLDGLVSAINGAGLGVTARVATDPNGSFLVIDDANGGTPSFTLTPSNTAQAGLARFAYGAATPQMTQAQGAQDAIIRMDGVDIARPSNTIDDVIDGVTLNLVTAQPGASVTLGATRPTDAITQAVSDFVAAYNELKTQIDTATASANTSADGTAGALYGNSSIREMQRQLSRLTSTVLTTAGTGPQTLAEIGVSTNRDGSLTLTSATLTAALNANPDAVEAMFNPTQHSSNPLLKITSAMGATKPGTYSVANVTASVNGSSAQGTIAGVSGVTTGTSLYASVTSAASGLVIEPQGDVASATITVDLGLGGALQAIRDSLRATGGVLDTLSSSLSTEKTSLADQRTKMQSDEADYQTRLTNQFASMNTQVTNYKSIQSYLEQQVAVWTQSK